MTTPQPSTRKHPEEWAAPTPLLYLCGLMLLVGAFTHSYEYIKLMRWVVFLTFAWSAYIAWHSRRLIPLATHVAVALVFNPVISFGLPRDFWIGLDIFASLLTCSVAWLSRVREPTALERENTRNLVGFVAGMSGLVLGAGSGVYLYKYLGIGELAGGLIAAALSAAGLYGAILLVMKLQSK